MSKELLLMIHPTFGALAMIASVWVFVETLNASEANCQRIRTASLLVTLLMWTAYIAGGYWYVFLYASDKAIIKAGPWPYAHSFVMEVKEHAFLMLLLLATYLPMATYADVVSNAANRKVVLWSCALLVLMTLGMEGSGAFISMGVKVGLLGK
jgi:hypothetical protein